MSLSHEVYSRHTLVVFKQSSELKKLELSHIWNSAVIQSHDQLLACVDRAFKNAQRLLVIVSETDFEKTKVLLNLRMQRENSVAFGLLVVTKEPSKFMEKEGGPTELLDAVSEKEAKKDIHLSLLRAVRFLSLTESKGMQKIGRRTLERMNEIFIDLSAERNPEKLLGKILTKTMQVTNAHAGALSMVQETDGELYFKLKITAEGTDEPIFQTTSMRVVENSFCGYVALTGKIHNVSDLGTLRPTSMPQMSRMYDFDANGKAVCVVTVPLKNSRNEVIGVLQLLNKKDERDPTGNGICPFEGEDESILMSFATQAAICLENVDLYADIQRLFEGFVKASVTAIESRDPSTGGHSERVAKICVALARATTDIETGIYRSVKFKEEEIRELEYAAMLHDFGKIGVREEVLVKAKKLYAHQLEGIQERIKICKAAAKIDYLEKRLKRAGKDSDLEKKYLERVAQIEGYSEIILLTNEPTILMQENMQLLEKIRSEQLMLPDGSNIALLTEDEYKALSVTKGSLTEIERLEIESHVRHTYQFLKMIPWTKDFKHLTEIAYCHHEKLDGTGYPRGLVSHEIPLQSKIMTIADIFDALTASDRWYKEAVTVEKAIQIIAEEVALGKIDPVLFEIFVQKKLFEVTHAKLLNHVA